LRRIRVCSVSDVPKSGGRSLKVGKLYVGVYHSNGKYYAASDICTHEDEFLAEGWFEGDRIECPMHGAQFSLVTGEALSLPATDPIRIYKIEVEGDDVFVYLPADEL
jgi:nitrite reductase/ring-hydroxylating ferredoxin subunit